MIPFHGKPFLQWQIELLSPQGFQEFVLVQQQQAIGSMSLVYRQDTDRYGSVTLTPTSQLAEFHARTPDLAPGLVNAVAYIFEPQILDFIPPDQQTSLEADIFSSIVQNQKKLYGILIDGTFIDMGTIDGYEQLLTELK